MMKRILALLLTVLLLLAVSVPALAGTEAMDGLLRGGTHNFSAPDAPVSWSGVYQMTWPVRSDTIYAVLAPQGHGRLVNSTSSVTFDYAVENGVPVSLTDKVVITVTEDDRLGISVGDLTLGFARIADPETDAPVAGHWRMIYLSSGSMVYDETVINLLHMGIDAWFHADGSVDWHAVSDRDSWVAQRWGIDEEGLFMDNGSQIVRISVDGDLMTYLLPYKGDFAQFTYRRVAD